MLKEKNSVSAPSTSRKVAVMGTVHSDKIGRHSEDPRKRVGSGAHDRAVGGNTKGPGAVDSDSDALSCNVLKLEAGVKIVIARCLAHGRIQFVGIADNR